MNKDEIRSGSKREGEMGNEKGAREEKKCLVSGTLPFWLRSISLVSRTLSSKLPTQRRSSRFLVHERDVMLQVARE